MRIIDWSSDVCSSDLCAHHAIGRLLTRNGQRRKKGRNVCCIRYTGLRNWAADIAHMRGGHRFHAQTIGRGAGEQAIIVRHLVVVDEHQVRSEEHTSELQSLMRISYAVFCLKKKTVRLVQTLYYIVSAS